MQILALGINQHSAPVELRERLAFPSYALPDALAGLRRIVPEGLLLSTCNRTEAYALAGDATAGAQSLIHFLCAGRDLAVDEVKAYLYTRIGEAAVSQLFSVAAGLDSMVLGEDQIL